MKFLSKDINFNQVIMLSEFEQLERPLLVEMIRLRQSPRKCTVNELTSQETTSLEEDLESFFKKDYGKEFADLFVKLNSNNHLILVHKVILAARCSYFEAFFRSFMPKDRRILVSSSQILLLDVSLCFILYM